MSVYCTILDSGILNLKFSNISTNYCFVENVPPVALYDDRIVEIQGEPAAMHKALELIASYLRKFLVDRTVIPLFEAQVCNFAYSLC
jgi:hypothetical protein